MTLTEKFNAIQKAKKLTDGKLADLMDCHAGTVADIRYGRSNIMKYFPAFIKAVEIEAVPLLDDDIAEYSKNLWLKDKLIDFDDKNSVNKIIDELIFVSTWCYDEDLSLLCDIFVATYYFKIGENTKGEEALKILKPKKARFNNEHLYLYYHLRGWLKEREYYFKAALILYLKAKSLEKKITVRKRYLGFRIGVCYTELCCPFYAILHLEEVLKNQDSFANTKVYLSTQRYLAINYARIKHKDNATNLLAIQEENFILEGVRDIKNVQGLLFAKGLVHFELEEYDKSEEYFDELFFESKNYKVMQLLSCYWKSMIYIEKNQKDKAMEWAKKGLELDKSNPFWFLIFDAVCKCLSIKTDADANYLDWTVVKKLSEYGQSYLVKICHRSMSAYYEAPDKKSHKIAHSYSKKILALQNQLMRGDVF